MKQVATQSAIFQSIKEYAKVEILNVELDLHFVIR